MSTIPGVKIKELDGALGLSAPSPTGLQVKVGVSCVGPTYVLQWFADAGALRDAIGNGLLTEAAAAVLASGGSQVGVMCVPPTTAGAPGAVAHAGSGLSALTVLAVPFAQVQIKALATGALGTVQVQISVNGGAWSSAYTTPASGAAWAIPVAPGLSVTFTTHGGNDFVAGDVWTISTTGTITLTGTGAATGALSSTSVVDGYSVVIQMLTAGTNPAAGTATFQYSIDGGNSFVGPVQVPTSGVFQIPAGGGLGTGLQVTWSAASLVAGDVYSFTCTAPAYNSTVLTTALQTLAGTTQPFEAVHAVGQPASASAAASLAAAMDTQIQVWDAAYQYAWGIIDGPVDTDANYITAFQNTVSSRGRVMVAVGNALNFISPSTGRQMSRPLAWTIAGRLAAIPVAQDPGAVEDGPLSLVGIPATGSALSRDERVTPNLDSNRLCTVMSIIGLAGFYVANGNTLAAVGSDFKLIQNRRVMDKALRITYAALVQYLSSKLRVNPKTGFILEREAQLIENTIGGKLRAQMRPGSTSGDCSDVSVVVDRTVNVLATNSLLVHVRLVPFGYAKSIEADIGFLNPALASAAK